MAFLDKLNKMAKVIEDKTADAIEFSNYNAAITAGENGFAMDIKKIGEFYYEFYVNGGTVEPNILAVLQSAKAHQDSIAQAKADIADDGYWGVEKTSDRILEFAKALSGDDPSKAEELLSAFKKGFDKATEAWGDKLPDISQKTYDAVIEKFNKWAQEE